MKRILAFLVALVTLLALWPVTASAKAAAELPAHIQDGVTLHCWNWSYKNIEANMAKIAAAGYNAVQVSPIQRSKLDTAGSVLYDWIYYYQPADFVIDDTGRSALGTKAEFQKMCQTAHAYGIKVIVDVVANHMAMVDGNDIDPAVIPELREDPACWRDISKNVTNYSDRYDITHSCLGGLPELDTSNKKVQGYVLDFLKECVDAGADGFRFDAAKHIETPEDQVPSDFWPTVIDGIRAYDPDVYIYGEILGSTGGVHISAYSKYMSVTENEWSDHVRDDVIGTKVTAMGYGYRKNAGPSRSVLWAESHDTFTGGGSGEYSTAHINKTWAVVAARADAMSLYFARPAAMSQKLGDAAVTGWSNVEVAAVNHFHNAFVGQSEHLSATDGIIAVERGDSGVVLVDSVGDGGHVRVDVHAMKSGTYTDAISGHSFKVADGQIVGTIGSTGIAVIYQVDACAHKGHGKDGHCAVCGLDGCHSYDNTGLCVCGAVEEKDRVIWFVNSEGWSQVDLYSWSNDPVKEYTGPWPGTAMEPGEDGMYRLTLPAGAQMVIFNNGSDKSPDLQIPAGKNRYDLATNTWDTYEPEPPQEEPKPTQPTEPAEAPAKQDQPEKADTWIIFAVAGAAVVAIAAVLVVIKRKK